MTLARRLAGFSAGLDFADLPSAVVASVRLRTLDILGIALAASTGETAPSLLGALECPLVCAVNGAAVGSGMEMAALADYCVASHTARFGMPEINHGLMPMARGIQQLVRVLGYNNAKKVLFEGSIYSAAEAEKLGLVHEIVEPEDLLGRADAWVTEMAAKPAHIFRALKRTVNQGMTMSDAELEEMTAADFESYYGTEEATSSLNTHLGRPRASAEERR